MNVSFGRLAHTTAPASVLLVRLLIGVVFVAEGIQKFTYADRLGAGRFAKIGLPWPEALGPLVGSLEIVCGLLVAAGFLTRLAVVPLIAIMIGALVSTKVPILLGRELWGFHLRELHTYGLLSALHESRTDLSMLVTCTFLWIVGSGPLSLDRVVWPGR